MADDAVCIAKIVDEGENKSFQVLSKDELEKTIKIL